MASLRKLVESSWVAYLTSARVGTSNIYGGIESIDKEAPCVICRAVQAEEDPYGSGNWRVACQVKVKCPAAPDANDAFDTLCASVRTAVGAADLNLRLQSAVSGFTVWGTSANDRYTWDIDGDCWVETIEVEILCAATSFGR